MGMRITVVEIEVLRPGQFDAAGREPFLEPADALRPGVDVAGRKACIQTMGTQRASPAGCSPHALAGTPLPGNLRRTT